MARSLRNAALDPKRDLSQEYLLPGEPVTTKPIQAAAEINSALPGYGTFPNRQWELLRAGRQVADGANVRLLIVNEPTYIGSGPNSDVNYNSFYERNLYDRFRAALTDFTRQHTMTYLDLWDFLPAEDFSNTSLHYDLAGNRLVAQKLFDALSAMH
jgi:hypothetical protein